VSAIDQRSREVAYPWGISEGTSVGDIECLICLQAMEGVDEFLIRLGAEGEASPAIMTRLEGAYGLCQRHSWQLVRVGHPDQLSALYQHLLRTTITRLEAAHEVLNLPRRGLQAKTSRRRRLLAARNLLRPRGPCPACVHQAGVVRQAIEHLVTAVSMNPPQREGHDLPMLCMSHFFRAVGSADRDTALVLLQAQRRVLQKLAEELGEYARKLDYRFRDEPKGEEQTAWLRAVRLFTGRRIEPPRMPLNWRTIIEARHRSGNLGIGILEALEQVGCSICWMAQGRMEQFFFWFLAESYHLLEVIEKLQRSFGFCPAHAHRFVDYREDSTVAFIYELLVKGTLQRIDALLGQSSRSMFTKGKWSWPSKVRQACIPEEICLACERVAEGTEANVFWLLNALKTPRGRELYRQSDGLCLIHFLMAIEKADEEGLLVELLEDQHRRFQGVLKILRAGGVEKAATDGGVEHLPWRNAVERFVGSES